MLGTSALAITFSTGGLSAPAAIMYAAQFLLENVGITILCIASNLQEPGYITLRVSSR